MRGLNSAPEHRCLSRLVFRRLIFLFWILGCGCTRPHAEPTGPSLARTDDLLDRCAAAYGNASTLRMKGTFSDFREAVRRVVPISWDLARPDRCRLQIDMDVAIVQGNDAWTYRSATRQFQGNRSRGGRPIATATAQISEGAPLLLPGLWDREDAALGKDPLRGYIGWRLEGANWSGERPCYVFSKNAEMPDRNYLLRIWIDQDLYFVREWSIVAPMDEGRERTIMACIYHEIVVNSNLPSDIFQLRPPAPIEGPRPAEEVQNSAGPIRKSH